MIILVFLAKERVATVDAINLGDPEVGRSCVKDDLKGLWRFTYRNGTIVLCIGIVLDGFGFALVDAVLRTEMALFGL